MLSLKPSQHLRLRNQERPNLCDDGYSRASQEFGLFRIPYANVLHEQLRVTQKAKSLVNPLNAFFPAY